MAFTNNPKIQYAGGQVPEIQHVYALISGTVEVFDNRNLRREKYVSSN